MLELRQVDLCFTSHEAADFLSRTMNLQISPEDTTRITARTEGWIAGLQMAALSMQTTDNIPGLIATLSGSHAFIFDYLLEEILKQQPPEIRRFLLYTSIVDQLNTALCDALRMGESEASPKPSSSAILKTLDQANLFLLPLDHERRWYRYHHLFADLLRLMLGQNEPGMTVELPEPLTERELEVLKLLAQGCSDREIAETLVIARETVHKHLKNIFGKLDVHNRTAAVARTRELNLL